VEVYTVEEVAAILRVDYKTVLRLIQRGLLKVLPGIRHKQIPEQELKRYMDVQIVVKGTQASATVLAKSAKGKGE
jgi:excisionase family DNA binding protein